MLPPSSGTREVAMSDSTELRVPDPYEVEAQANSIIKKHMGLAMAGGIIPIPLVDLAAVTAVQLDMLKQLASTYAVPFESGSARAFVTSLTSALAGTSAARMGASLIKLVPVIGTLAGGAAQVVVTGASTYAVGNLFKRLFRDGRSIEQLTVGEVKDELMSYFDAGKDIARDLTDNVKDKATSVKNLVARRSHHDDDDEE
jgi:uncharacterized protein (DUF697 family)